MTQPQQQAVRKDFDVVVAGCGVGGLASAVAAAEAGARVAVLERSTKDERGGQSRYTEAYLRMKTHTEVTDDFESWLAENGCGAIDPELVAEAGAESHRSSIVRALSLNDPLVIQHFADNAASTIAWFQEMGVRFEFLPTQFLTKSQPRLLPVGGGQALVEAGAARAEKLGVTFFYETTAQDLLRNADGSIAGLSVVSRSQGAMEIRGEVILASGGFEGNSEMMTRYVGPRSVYLRPICKGGYYNRGEGIRMALDAGAAACGEFGSYHAEPVDPRSGIAEPSVFIFPYGILVNSDGERFTDEAPGAVDHWYERITRRIYEQRGGMAWCILDARLQQVPNWRLGLRSDKPPVTGSTIAELAKNIGVDADTLEATVSRYNQACGPGTWKPLEVDGLATQGLKPPKSNWALPLDQGPFQAYPIMSANVFTFGGLKVDTSARVVDADGEPMPGLYAAGEIIGMYYGNYVGATSVLKGMVFGRIAGTHAAQRRKQDAGTKAAA